MRDLQVYVVRKLPAWHSLMNTLLRHSNCTNRFEGLYYKRNRVRKRGTLSLMKREKVRSCVNVRFTKEIKSRKSCNARNMGTVSKMQLGWKQSKVNLLKQQNRSPVPNATRAIVMMRCFAMPNSIAALYITYFGNSINLPSIFFCLTPSAIMLRVLKVKKESQNVMIPRAEDATMAKYVIGQSIVFVLVPVAHFSREQKMVQYMRCCNLRRLLLRTGSLKASTREGKTSAVISSTNVNRIETEMSLPKKRNSVTPPITSMRFVATSFCSQKKARSSSCIASAFTSRLTPLRRLAYNCPSCHSWRGGGEVREESVAAESVELLREKEFERGALKSSDRSLIDQILAKTNSKLWLMNQQSWLLTHISFSGG